MYPTHHLQPGIKLATLNKYVPYHILQKVLTSR